MKVSIDQERCTGDAQCVEVCPEVFFMHEDDGNYRGFVRNVGDSACGPTGVPKLRMADERADVPRSVESAVVEAAELCPGECIVVLSDE
jgi:ferredoxin